MWLAKLRKEAEEKKKKKNQSRHNRKVNKIWKYWREADNVETEKGSTGTDMQNLNERSYRMWEIKLQMQKTGKGDPVLHSIKI